MKAFHSTIFITVVAWSQRLSGKVIKTNAMAKIPIHEKCLEAKKNEDGTWRVISYADSNLDGIAEIRELRLDE